MGVSFAHRSNVPRYAHLSNTSVKTMGLGRLSSPSIRPIHVLGQMSSKKNQPSSQKCSSMRQASGGHALADAQCHQRPLSGLERFFYEVAKQGENDTISGYQIEFIGQLPSREKIEDALLQLQELLPGLKTQIQEQGGRLVFIEPEAVKPLGYEEQIIFDDSDWQAVMSKRIKVPLDPSTDSLVQFIALRNPKTQNDQMLAIAHHSLVDGEGMLHIYQKLLELLEKPTNMYPSTTDAIEHLDRLLGTTDEQEPPVCPLHMERYKFKTPSLGFLGSIFFTDFLAKKIMPIFKEHNLQENTNIAKLKLSPGHTKLLLAAAKRNDVSVYGAVASAAIRTSSEFFPINRAGQLITTFVPVSLRRRLGEDVHPQELGCYTSLVRDVSLQSPKDLVRSLKPVETKEDHDGFWALASKAQGQMRESLVRGDHEAMPFIFEQFFKGGGDPRLLAKGVVPDTLILNNLGRQSLKGFGQLKPTSFSWVTSFGALAPGVSVNFLSLNNQLEVGLFSRRLDQATLEKFQDRFQAELEAVVRSPLLAPR